MEDPLLKELLTTFKEDSQRLAQDILSGLWLQAAVSLVALFLAVSSTVRLALSLLGGSPGEGPGPGSMGPGPGLFYFELALTIVLFLLSVYSLRTYIVLRRRYSRISSLATRIG